MYGYDYTQSVDVHNIHPSNMVYSAIKNWLKEFQKQHRMVYGTQ